LIKQSLNRAENCSRRPRKRCRKSRPGSQSAVRHVNSITNADEPRVSDASDSIIQTNSFDELIDTQKLIEFAISSSNPKDIDDFEPAQMMQSDYLEGPIVKIEEFPGTMSGSSAGTSAADDDMLLCYMTHSSTSVNNVAGISEQNLSFKQPVMVNAAAVAQGSSLSLPLTLPVNGASLDDCSAMQFS